MFAGNRAILRRFCFGIALGTVCCGDLAAAPLSIVAYINQSSGCQTATETFLAQLAATYGDRLTLEIVDFGGKGKDRWLADGMHCMGIMVNGSLEHTIWDRGAQISVTFRMPAGYLWQHHDLELLVRQTLDGVLPGDKEVPKPSLQENDGISRLLIAGDAVLESRDATTLRAASETLAAAGAEAPILQEEFAVREKEGTVELTLRGKTVLNAPPESIRSNDGETVHSPGEKLQSIIQAYPRRTRPFPGMNMPFRRR